MSSGAEKTWSVCGAYWISSNSSQRKTTEPAVTAMSLPNVNASGSTIDGTRGADIMSSTKWRNPRTALSPPVSISAFQPQRVQHRVVARRESFGEEVQTRIGFARRHASRGSHPKTVDPPCCWSQGRPAWCGEATDCPATLGRRIACRPWLVSSSDRPSAIDTSSRPSDAARDATVLGCLARFSANLLHAVLGIIRSAMPSAELVNSRSRGAASSSALRLWWSLPRVSCLLGRWWFHFTPQQLARRTSRVGCPRTRSGAGTCTRRHAP